MFLFGVFNGLFECTVWPSFTTLVKEKDLGKAFSFVSMSNNVWLAIIPIWNGYLFDTASKGGPEDYSLVLLSMFTMLCVGLVIEICLFVLKYCNCGTFLKECVLILKKRPLPGAREAPGPSKIAFVAPNYPNQIWAS